jgi:hypothetical protein
MGQGIPGLERLAEVGFIIQRLMLTYDGFVNLEPWKEIPLQWLLNGAEVVSRSIGFASSARNLISQFISFRD